MKDQDGGTQNTKLVQKTYNITKSHNPIMRNDLVSIISLNNYHFRKSLRFLVK